MEPMNYQKRAKGYCDDNEVGEFILALSGIDATICAILDISGFICSSVKPFDLERPPNSLAIWSTPLFSSRHSTSNLSLILKSNKVILNVKLIWTVKSQHIKCMHVDNQH